MFNEQHTPGGCQPLTPPVTKGMAEFGGWRLTGRGWRGEKIGKKQKFVYAQASKQRLFLAGNRADDADSSIDCEQGVSELFEHRGGVRDERPHGQAGCGFHENAVEHAD